MAISFINGNGASATNGGNPSVDMSSWGLQQDDLVISVLNPGWNLGDYNVAMSTAGYTEVADLYADDTRDANVGVFYKFMGASPDATAVGAGSGNASDSTALVVMVFRGVDTAGPFDATATTDTGTSSANARPPSITFSTAGVWVVIAAGSTEVDASTGSYTFPTGYTVNAKQKTGDDTLDTIVGMGYNSSPTSPEDPGDLTSLNSGTSDAWCAVTMALKPSSDGSQFMTILVGV